jgi:predicted nucleic acid-binding protein
VTGWGATTCTGAMRFVDTNVLLYAVSTAPEEGPKKQTALAVLDEEDVVLSVQVLQEFYVQATHATRIERLSHDDAVALVESWLRFRVQETSLALLRSAMACAARWNVSYWDAAIVEAAREAGCSTLLSEDLQDGMDFAGVRVVDPFA